MKRLIYVYGLAGEEQNYRVIQYTFFDVDLTRDITIEMHRQADWLRGNYSSIEHVYAVNGGRGLKYIYLDAVKRNTIESNVVFKTLLEQRGVLVL